MNNDEWAIVKDIIFLYESGISPEDIAKVKKLSIEKVQSIVGNVKIAIKKRNKMNVVQEIGNQNQWKDELPAEEILAQMVEGLEAEDRHDGAERFQVGQSNAQIVLTVLGKIEKCLTDLKGKKQHQKPLNH